MTHNIRYKRGGDMSIQKKKFKLKSGKTTVKYYPTVFDKKTGKVVWGKGHKLLRDAKKEELEMIERLNFYGKLETDKSNFGEVAKLWLDSTKSTYADKTWRNYEYYYNHYIKEIFEDRPISEIYPEHILKYKNIQEESLKAETINKIINILCNIFNFAKDTLKIIERSPMESIKRNKVFIEKKNTWTEEQINYFLNLDFVKESPYYNMLILLFSIGCRPGELCGLSVNDINNNVLSFNRGLNSYGNVSDLKTSSSHRPVVLSDDLCRIINRQKFTRRALNVEHDFLFVTPIGTPVRPKVLSDCFRKLQERNNKEYKEDKKNRIELPHIRLYDARHSFATNLMLDGVKDKVISEVMGNTVKTMQHHYAHVKETMHEEILNKYSQKLISKNWKEI